MAVCLDSTVEQFHHFIMIIFIFGVGVIDFPTYTEMVKRREQEEAGHLMRTGHSRHLLQYFGDDLALTVPNI